MNDWIKINLKTIQQIYISRFNELHQFLLKNKIRYFAVGGTTLGMVRHKGFIPWDNDIDIGMYREDYEKFKKIAYQLPKDKFCLSGYMFDKKKPVSHALIKVSIVGTKQTNNQFDKFDKCFHIDVFPYDKVPNNIREQRKIAKKHRFYQELLYFKTIKKSDNFFKTILVKMIQLFLLFISSNYIAKKMDKFAKSYSDSIHENTSVTNFMGVYSYFGEMVPNKSIGTPKLSKFENIEFFFPEDCDLFLKSVYGINYMIPSKRINENTFFGFAKKELLDELKINYEE